MLLDSVSRRSQDLVPCSNQWIYMEGGITMNLAKNTATPATVATAKTIQITGSEQVGKQSSKLQGMRKKS